MNAALQLVDSPAWSIAGWSLLHYLWVGAALGVSAWLLKRAVRPLSPQARYAVAVAMFAALAVAPPFVAWRVATDRANDTVAAGALPAVSTESLPAFGETAHARLSSAPSLPTSILPPTQSISPPVETIEAFLIRHGSNALSAAVRWAPAVWLFGMPLTFAFLATGLFGAERLRQRSSPLADGPIADAARRWAEALRISRTVAVGVTDRVVAPLVIGVLRPMIVLPASIVARQSPEQMEMILLHELAHVRRADNLINLIQRVVEAVLFFQPAVWFVSRWVRLEREHCCDNMVLSYTGDPQGYAETLASLAMPGISPAYAAAAMANHQLVSRIQHILSREEQTMSLSPKIAAVAGAICLVVGLSLSGAAQQTTPAEDRATAKQAATDGGRVVAIDITGGSVEQPYSASIGTVLDEGLGKIGDEFVVTNSDAGLSDSVFLAHVRSRNATGEKRSWGPEQASGAPDVPNAGDDTRAWASLTPDGQDEWLELNYAEPVEVIAVQVFANYCPGAVSRVTVFDANTSGLQYTWQGEDPVKANGARARGASIITIPASIKTNRVRIELASKSVAGWNEIDAVGLLDANGKTHWANEAAASSTYADQAAVPTDPSTQMEYKLYRSYMARSQSAQEQSAAASLLAQFAEQNREHALDGRDWSPDQATGAPADLSAAEQDDRRHAWRPAQPDAGRETLNVFYDEPVKAKLLLVYELGQPATVDILCRDAHGTEHRVLSGREVNNAGKSSVLSLPLDGKIAISSVALGLDTAAVTNWTDIDAVGLIDADGKVHWANRAKATSTHADVADRAMNANHRGLKWLQDHGQHTSNATCASCHKDASATESGGNRTQLRVPVKELLEKSDSDLRDWLKKHGAANIHIDENGEATVEFAAGQMLLRGRRIHVDENDAATVDGATTVEGATTKSFLNAIQAKPEAAGDAKPAESGTADVDVDAKPALPAVNDGSQAAPNRGSGADPNAPTGDAVARDVSNQVQIALAAGERGYFSRPDRKIVRAERVEVQDAKNVLSITITSDGLEFVGSEPGAGRLRCWDQSGQMIEVSVTVEAKPLPAGDPRANPNKAPKQSPTPDPRDGSKTDVATALDRLVLDLLDKTDDASETGADGPTLARRAYLDLFGVLPTVEQVNEFVGDGSDETLAESMRELMDKAAASRAERE